MAAWTHSTLPQEWLAAADILRGDPSMMKTLLCAAIVLAATAAFGQTASVIPSQVSPIYVPDHPQHASQHGMAKEESVLENNCNVSAHGERPLWEFASPRVERPLGDIARELRRQRDYLAAKRASSVVENQ